MEKNVFLIWLIVFYRTLVQGKNPRLEPGRNSIKLVLVPLFLVLLCPFTLLAQPDTLWTKTFGGPMEDKGYSIQLAQGDGYIIAGLTYSLGAGGADVWLIKTNSLGDTLWTKTYGGTNDDWAEYVDNT